MSSGVATKIRLISVMGVPLRSFKIYCEKVLPCYRTEGDCLAAKLRPGNGHSAKDRAELCEPTVRTTIQQQAITLNSDFWKQDVLHQDAWRPAWTGGSIWRFSSNLARKIWRTGGMWRLGGESQRS